MHVVHNIIYIYIVYTTSAAFASYFQRSVRIRVYWPDVRAGGATTPHRDGYLPLSTATSPFCFRKCDRLDHIVLCEGREISGSTYFRGRRAGQRRPETWDNFVGTRNLKTNMNKRKRKTGGKKTYTETGRSLIRFKL